MVSSSWAWKTLDKVRAAEGFRVRTIATEALSRGFVRFSGEARDAHRRGLIMAELPDIDLIAQANALGATEEVLRQLNGVVEVVKRRIE